MKVGNVVKVVTSKGPRYGILMTLGKKRFMVGRTVDVLVDNEIQTFLEERVEDMGEESES